MIARAARRVGATAALHGDEAARARRLVVAPRTKTVALALRAATRSLAVGMTADRVVRATRLGLQAQAGGRTRHAHRARDCGGMRSRERPRPRSATPKLGLSSRPACLRPRQLWAEAHESHA